MKNIHSSRLVLALAICVAPLAFLDSRDVTPRQEESGESGLFTFYAADDLASSFDFRRGRAGGTVVDGEVSLANAQMAFDVLAPDRISFGFGRNERVDILDLGPIRIAPHRRGQDPGLELSSSLFQTLFLDRDRFSYRGAGGTLERYPEARRILGTLPAEGVYHLEPVVGNTYVVRVQRRGVGQDDEFFKFLVVDVESRRTLTIRWARIEVR